MWLPGRDSSSPWLFLQRLLITLWVGASCLRNDGNAAPCWTDSTCSPGHGALGPQAPSCLQSPLPLPFLLLQVVSPPFHP